MPTNRRALVACSATAFLAGLSLGSLLQPGPAARAQSATRVFEIRRYTTHEGKLDALNARFRDQTMRLFEKHGMTNIGYWTPQDAPQSANTLIYILAHPSREAATKNWDEFRADPDWVKARSASETAGAIVSKVDSIFLNPTDYAPMK